MTPKERKSAVLRLRLEMLQRSMEAQAAPEQGPEGMPAQATAQPPAQPGVVQEPAGGESGVQFRQRRLQEALAEQANPTPDSSQVQPAQQGGEFDFDAIKRLLDPRRQIAARNAMTGDPMSREARLVDLPNAPVENIDGPPGLGAALGATAVSALPVPPFLKAPVKSGVPRELFMNSLKAVTSSPAKAAGRVAFRSAGAGVGGALGETAQLALEGDAESIDQLTELALAAGKREAITDPLARGILGLAKMLVSPLRSQISATAKKVLDFARDEKLPIDMAGLTAGRAGDFFGDIASRISRSFLPSALIVGRPAQRNILRVMSADPKQVGALMSEIAPKAFVEIEKTGARIVATSKRLKLNPDLVAKMVNESSDAGVAMLKRRTTKAEFDDLMQMHLSGVLNQSIKSLDGSVSNVTGEVFDGGKLLTLLRANEKFIQKHYPKAMLKRLKGFAMYARANSDVPLDLKASALVSPAGFISAAVLASGGLQTAVDPTGLAGATSGLAMLLARGVFNPNSAVAHWLTTGALPTSARNAGVRAAANVAGKGIEMETRRQISGKLTPALESFATENF